MVWTNVSDPSTIWTETANPSGGFGDGQPVGLLLAITQPGAVGDPTTDWTGLSDVTTTWTVVSNNTTTWTQT